MRGCDAWGSRSGRSAICGHRAELVARGERRERRTDEVRVRYPTTVVPHRELELLVGAHLGGLLGAPLGGAARCERGHAAHAERAVAVAHLDEPERVALHPGAVETDGRAVGEHAVRMTVEALDVAEDLVPPAHVHRRGMPAGLEEDLLDLERGGERLDQERGLERAGRHAERLLDEREEPIPPARLEVVLAFGHVELRRSALREELPRAVPGARDVVEEPG